MTAHHSPRTRDAGLRKIARVRRWLVGGSVALTGVLTAIAANAFPGKTGQSREGHATGTASKETAASSASASNSAESTEGSSSSLSPPAQAPQAASGESGESVGQ